MNMHLICLLMVPCILLLQSCAASPTPESILEAIVGAVQRLAVSFTHMDVVLESGAPLWYALMQPAAALAAEAAEAGLVLRFHPAACAATAQAAAVAACREALQRR